MSARLKWFWVLALGIGIALSGCGGGSSGPGQVIPVNITTTALPAATADVPYSQQLAATGGTSSYTWTLTTPVTGFSLSTSGLLAGTPTSTTSLSFQVKATDATNSSNFGTSTLSLTVNPGVLKITTTSLANGNVNTAYSATLQSTGGTAPITWSMTSGSLPQGLTLNASTGIITGTPTESGVFSLTFQAADSSNPQQLAPKALGLTIDGATLAITTTSLLNPMVGENYDKTLQFTGGTLPVTWSLASGTLPAGLLLDPSTGAITGMPLLSAVGTTNFTVELVDSSAPTPQTKLQPLSLTVTTATACGSGSESLLNGQYAISMLGFDGSGPAAMLGFFVADGSGNITAGQEDINSSGPGGVQTNLPVTTAGSSYSIGSDHRGCLTLVASGVTRVFRFSVGVIAAGLAASARTIEFDTTGMNTAGLIQFQNPSYFSNASISGSYTFRVKSPIAAGSGGGFFAGIGAWNLSGTTVTGSGDFNFNGVVDQGNAGYPGTPIIFSAGTYNIGSNGRGTLSFTPPGASTIHLIVYVLDNTQLLLMSSDTQSATSTLFSGVGSLQFGGPFGPSALNAPSLLFGSGRAGTGTGSRVEAGVFTPDGVGSFTFSGDQNSAGTAGTQTTSGSYTVSSNGRVQVINTGGTAPAMLFYLAGVNEAYGISTDANVMTVDAEPHSGGPHSNASITGAYSFATIDPVVAGSGLTVGIANYDGAGNVTGTFDSNENGSLSIGNAISGTYMVSAEGRTVAPASGTTKTLTYIIYTGKVVSFDYTSDETNPTLVIGQP